MVAAYIRVSSKAQNHATQRDAIERAMRAAGDDPAAAEWFAETKSATKTLARPELDRLRAKVRAGQVQRLYVFRLDRFARTGIRDTLEVVDEAKACGARLVTIADGFDPCGPFAEMIAAVLGWAAKMETLARSERVAAARERMEAAGEAWGRPERMTIDQKRRAVALRAGGASLRSIAQAVGAPRATVARCLKKHEAKKAAETAPAAAQAAPGPAAVR